MTAKSDPTFQYRFATIEEAEKFAQEGGFDLLVELEGKEYEDKPFMVVKKEWITNVRQVVGDKDGGEC